MQCLGSLPKGRGDRGQGTALFEPEGLQGFGCAVNLSARAWHVPAAASSLEEVREVDFSSPSSWSLPHFTIQLLEPVFDELQAGLETQRARQVMNLGQLLFDQAQRPVDFCQSLLDLNRYRPGPASYSPAQSRGCLLSCS